MPENSEQEKAQSGADVSKQDAAGSEKMAGDGQLEATEKGPKVEEIKQPVVGTPAKTVTGSTYASSGQTAPTGPDYASMSSSQMAENWEATLEWYKSQV